MGGLVRRSRRLVRPLGAAAAALLLAPSIAVAGGAATDTSERAEAVARLPYVGGTSLDFDGKYVYAGQWDGKFERGERPDQGGAFIIDVSGRKPKKVGYAACAGNDANVATVRPGLLAIGYNSGPKCLPIATIVLFDTSDPANPRLLGGVQASGGTHTLTPYPGKPLLYSSPGGLGSPIESIVDVSDPHRPKVAATFSVRPLGCHDWSFRITKDERLGFCAGGGQTSIWDVSDPLKPQIISVISNPLIEFPHYALASPDGKVLVIEDEAFAGHECVTGHSPTGALWFYDISNLRAPIPLGRYAVGRGSQPVGVFEDVGPVNGWVDSWCTAHNYNFVGNTRILVAAWFSGGTTILDISNPSLPKELAHYRPKKAVANTAYWHDGSIYVNDFARGFEVLTVKGIND